MERFTVSGSFLDSVYRLFQCQQLVLFVQVVLRRETPGTHVRPDLLAESPAGPRPANADREGMGVVLQQSERLD